ncbi:hypothetical protein ACQY0O_001360 [Thecaphora frezii]
MRTFTAPTYAALAALATLATGAQAQIDTSIITGLSAGCGQSILGLLSNKDISSCLSLTQAVSALGGAGNGSIVPALDGYFSGAICPQAPCASTALNSTVQSLSTACADDVKKGASLPTIILTLLQNYDAVRSVGCLQDTSNKQLCLIETLYAVQNATGKPLTLQAVSAILSGDSTATQQIVGLASNKTLLCTNCNDAILTSLSTASISTSSKANATQSPIAQLAQGAGQTCGANFTDGQIPTSVKQTAQGSSTSASSSSNSSTSATQAAKENDAASLRIGAAAVATAALGLLASGFVTLF